MCGESGSIRDLDYVLWEVPLSVLVQLVHVKLRARDVWTIEPLPPIAPQAQQTLARVASTNAEIQW